MRFQAEHRFKGSPSEVAALLTDSRFYQNLVLPDLSTPEVLDSGSLGGRSLLRLRYEFVGDLDAVARRLIGQARLAWIQQVTVDQSNDSGDLSFSAEAEPRRLHGFAHFELQSCDGGCVRRLAGELVVAVPLLGSRAERRIVPGVLRRLDIEAQGINNTLERGHA
jgi:hypothetical protein